MIFLEENLESLNLDYLDFVCLVSNSDNVNKFNNKKIYNKIKNLFPQSILLSSIGKNDIKTLTDLYSDKSFNSYIEIVDFFKKQ